LREIIIDFARLEITYKYKNEKMPHPRTFAQNTPDKPAYIMASTGETITYLELEKRANRVAHLFRKCGLKAYDHVAMMMENHSCFFEIIWGALRSGIIITPISTALINDEVDYILRNCEAKLFITSPKYSPVGKSALNIETIAHFYMIEETMDGFESYEAAIAAMPDTPIEDEIQGTTMLYSSGTTGLPKGTYTPPHSEALEDINPVLDGIGKNFRFGPHVRYLSPAPLYHAAPLAYNMVNMLFGGTSIIMEKFDAEWSLAMLEKYKANYSQWVPIMFVRMLKLPAEIREKYDVSSMMLALHAAAPCPIEIKEQMIDWWGPVIFEYYGASEGNGLTAITSQEWLAHKGSVGRAIIGKLLILDDEGNELPAEEIGNVYFTGGNAFKYYNEPEKTAKSYARPGCSTVGDIGYMDQDGYLYLTDRKNFTIITGGVNVYPQEIENCIINHPKVADVAVFGIPNEEFGQEVKAVVQPKTWADAGADFEKEIIDFCRKKLSKIKVPRSVDFDAALPRKDNGKLYKRRLLERYQ
jgi:fatty-acyl-CoA synthase